MEVNLIRSAMSRWQETVLDPELKKYYRIYKIKEDLDGHKVAVCGKGFFCLAFRMIPESGGYSEEKCLRIWHKDGNLLNLRLQERSQLVSQEISRIHNLIPKNQHRYFIDYDYREKAINVNGSILSGIIMPWINGRSLDQYIREHRDRTSLLNLANEFMTMFQTFKKYGIAHGDLSNTNILITPEGKIKLIDYDSVFVPLMRNYRGREAFYQITGGQAPFQHPERLAKDHLMSADDDNFSQHVIYLSLLAMAYKPELIDIISDKELLFTPLDLQSGSAFTKTDIYKKIDSIDNQEVQFRLQEMAKALRGSLSQVRSIVDIIPLVEYCTTCGNKFNNNMDRYCTKCGAIRDEISNSVSNRPEMRNDYINLLLGRRSKCNSCGYQSSQDRNYCGNCGKPYSAWSEKEVTYKGVQHKVDVLKDKYEINPTFATAFQVIGTAVKNLFNRKR